MSEPSVFEKIARPDPSAEITSRNRREREAFKRIRSMLESRRTQLVVVKVEANGLITFWKTSFDGEWQLD